MSEPQPCVVSLITKVLTICNLTQIVSFYRSRKGKQDEEEIVSISSNTESENESGSDEESSEESDSGKEDDDDDSKSSYKPHCNSVNEEVDSSSDVDFDESEDDSEEEESVDETSEDCEVNTGDYERDLNDTNMYGEIVPTKDPDYMSILDMTVNQVITSAHVSVNGFGRTAYMLCSKHQRMQLKDALSQEYSTCVLRKKKERKKTSKYRAGLAEGFNPDSESEDDSSDSDSEMEEAAEKLKAEMKKKVSSSKNSGCKPSKSTREEDNLDDSDDGISDQESSERKIKNVGKKGGRKSNSKKEKNRKPVKKGKHEGKKNSLVQARVKDDGGDVIDEADDDESVDFDDPKIMENLEKQVKESSPVDHFPVYVSCRFYDPLKKQYVYLVTFGKPGRAFYLKALHQKSVLVWLHNRKLMGNMNNIPEWINTISYYKLRSEEHGLESKYYKTGGNGKNTVELVYFILTLDKIVGHTVQNRLVDILRNHFCKVFKARNSNPPGSLALEFTKTLGNDPNKGLYNWLLTNRSTNKDPELCAKNMTKEIDETFAGGPAFHYDTPLDKFMCDFDIKTFLTSHVGVHSWDDLNNEDKRACYRDHPTRRLPKWEEIIQESF